MTVTTFGSFPNGGLSEFQDPSANGGAGGVTIMASDWVAGKYKARFHTNPTTSPVYYNDSTKVRIHLLGNSGVSALLVQDSVFCRAMSYSWTSGSPLTIYAGDEIHASGSVPLANGPAPLNGYGITNGKHVWRIRGGGDSSVNTFNQWTFGNSPEADDNGVTRRSQSFVGLSEAVVTNEWLHTFYIMNFHPTNGYFELWACTHGGQMVNVVPRKTGIGTMYASPITHYPMLSMYYDRSGSADHDLEMAAGAYGNTVAELKTWQAQQLGYDPWSGGGGTPPPSANARITLNPSVVDHTLPAKFWGLGHSPYASNNDQPITAYKNLVNALQMEVFRAHSWGDGTDPNQAQTVALKAMALDYTAGSPGMKTILQLNARSVNASQNPTGNYPNDMPTSGNGSPAQMASTLDSWLNSGLNVGWLEPYNEPYNNFVGGVGDNWKNSSAGYGDPGDACRDWAAIYHKLMYQGVKTYGGAVATVPMAGCVIAGAARDYIYGEVLRWCEPNVYIPSTPRSDTNLAFFDTFSCHAYLSVSGTQSGINSMFYTGAPDNDARSATTAFCNNFRNYLISKGKSATDMIFTECAVFNGGSVGGLFDTAYAVMFARNQARWNVGCFIYHSIDTTNVDHVINDSGHTHSTYQRTVRYRVMEQMVSPFIRLYKKQLLSDANLTWSTAPGQSAAGNVANSVPRLQIAAGLNAAGDSVGVLVANVDLSTAETLTIDMPAGVTITGAASFVKMPNNIVFSGSDQPTLPVGSISPASASTLNINVGAAEAYFVTIPVAGTGGGGQGGGGGGGGGTAGTTPPINSNGARMGVTVAGATFNGFSADYKSGSKLLTGLQPGSTGSLKKVHLYTLPGDLSASTQALKLAVYAPHATTGEPDTYLGGGDVLLVPGSDVAQWRTFELATPVTFTQSALWVLIHADGPSNRVYYGTDVSQGGLRYNIDTYADGPSNPAGVMGSDNIFMSLVGDYDVTVAGGDITPPLAVSAQLAGDVISLSYSETLDPAATPPLPADFAVLVNAVAREVYTISVSGNIVTLKIAHPLATYGQTVTLSYTGVTGRKLQDAAGNFAVNLTAYAVTNLNPQGMGTRTTSVARSVNPAGRIVGQRRIGEGGGI